MSLTEAFNSRNFRNWLEIQREAGNFAQVLGLYIGGITRDFPEEKEVIGLHQDILNNLDPEDDAQTDRLLEACARLSLYAANYSGFGPFDGTEGIGGKQSALNKLQVLTGGRSIADEILTAAFCCGHPDVPIQYGLDNSSPPIGQWVLDRSKAETFLGL